MEVEAAGIGALLAGEPVCGDKSSLFQQSHVQPATSACSGLHSTKKTPKWLQLGCTIVDSSWTQTQRIAK